MKFTVGVANIVPDEKSAKKGVIRGIKGDLSDERGVQVVKLIKSFIKFCSIYKKFNNPIVR